MSSIQKYVYTSEYLDTLKYRKAPNLKVNILIWTQMGKTVMAKQGAPITENTKQAVPLLSGRHNTLNLNLLF